MSTDTMRANAQTLPKPGTKRWKNFVKWADVEFASAPVEELARLKPPSNDEWAKMTRSDLVDLRIAHRILAIDKAANIAALNELNEEESAGLFYRLEEGLDRFRCFADLADQALERLLCAAAKIALDREGGM
jgi:hypothetical protein